MRKWDRRKAVFVDVIVQNPLDSSMSCQECRYYASISRTCSGVGSKYHMKRVPFPEFIPNQLECEVRLPPELLAFTS